MFAACVLMISSLTSCNKSPDDAASGSVSGIATMEKPAVYTVPEGDEKSNDYIISVWTEDNAEKQSVDCFTAKVGTSANGLDSVSYEKMSFCMFWMPEFLYLLSIQLCLKLQKTSQFFMSSIKLTSQMKRELKSCHQFLLEKIKIIFSLTVINLKAI